MHTRRSGERHICASHARRHSAASAKFSGSLHVLHLQPASRSRLVLAHPSSVQRRVAVRIHAAHRYAFPPPFKVACRVACIRDSACMHEVWCSACMHEVWCLIACRLLKSGNCFTPFVCSLVPVDAEAHSYLASKPEVPPVRRPRTKDQLELK